MNSWNNWGDNPETPEGDETLVWEIITHWELVPIWRLPGWSRRVLQTDDLEAFLRELPEELRVLLENPNVVSVGGMVISHNWEVVFEKTIIQHTHSLD
jgi:hypothetical protein